MKYKAVMKYKAGDKVLIKTWEDLVKSHIIHTEHPASQKYLDKSFSNRIITIDEVVGNYCYKVYGCSWRWFDYMIDCSLEDVETIPINNRFEILDL